MGAHPRRKFARSEYHEVSRQQLVPTFRTVVSLAREVARFASEARAALEDGQEDAVQSRGPRVS